MHSSKHAADHNVPMDAARIPFAPTVVISFEETLYVEAGIFAIEDHQLGHKQCFPTMTLSSSALLYVSANFRVRHACGLIAEVGPSVVDLSPHGVLH
jgi:hypothetical protein